MCIKIYKYYNFLSQFLKCLYNYHKNIYYNSYDWNSIGQVFLRKSLDERFLKKILQIILRFLKYFIKFVKYLTFFFQKYFLN